MSERPSKESIAKAPEAKIAQRPPRERMKEAEVYLVRQTQAFPDLEDNHAARPHPFWTTKNAYMNFVWEDFTTHH